MDTNDATPPTLPSSSDTARSDGAGPDPGSQRASTPDPGSPVQAERLARWEERTRPLIIAAAVLPLLGVVSSTRPDAVVWIVAFATWFVFLIDLIVHVRLSPGYLRTHVGWFDLGLVLLTFPWYLVLGNDAAGFAQAFRLARLGRVGMAFSEAPRVRRLIQRLGRPLLYVVVMWVTCSIIVVRADGPSEGFTNIGAGLWWGIVTLTTVGYGDLVPHTTVGRLAATVLMITGVALLGTIAASLASLFGSEDAAADATSKAAGGPDETVDVASVREQLDELHEELRAIRALLVDQGGGAPTG
jgi:voltage-gated potassium channel